MNQKKAIISTNWEVWGKVAFSTYCLATLFMIFFSTSAIQIWSYPWNRLSILGACLLPLLMVFVWKIPTWINNKKFGEQLLFVPIIIILGILNIIFSEDRDTTLKVMTLFLISGIGGFLVTSCSFTNKFRLIFFLWLCWLCLLSLYTYGIFEHTSKKPILLLSFNPIPAGSLLLLLFVGPLLLFPSSPLWLRFLQILSIIFGIVLFVSIGKRGPIMGILAMVLLFCSLLRGRKLWVIPLIALVMIGTVYKIGNHLPRSLKRNLISHESTLFRLENYAFATHIFFRKPLFGIGLHSPLTEYLKDYRQKISNSKKYSKFIHEKKTFENIILCGFVEMGGLFSIIYLALIIYLLRNLFKHIKERPEKRLQSAMLLIPMAGFFVHSMTFDSLLYPHLNWLFHSYLGLMANFHKI